MSQQNNNHKELYQRVSCLEANYNNLKESVGKIENQVSNHIPTELKEIKDEFNKFKSQFTINLLAATVLLIITQIIIKVFVK